VETILKKEIKYKNLECYLILLIYNDKNYNNLNVFDCIYIVIYQKSNFKIKTRFK
jgi:hypothetical protein